MSYTNAQILAAVVTEWSRPAVSQIAAERLASLSMVQSLQGSIISSGLVSQNYRIASEIMPFAQNAVNILIQPVLENSFSRIPDATIPALAHKVVETAMQQPKFSVLEGLVEFDQEDLAELKLLLDKNLPVTKSEGYQIIN